MLKFRGSSCLISDPRLKYILIQMSCLCLALDLCTVEGFNKGCISKRSVLLFDSWSAKQPSDVSSFQATRFPGGKPDCAHMSTNEVVSEGYGHWNRHATRSTRKRNLRSKFWWLTEFCNSHYVSHVAAFFIVARAKISVAVSCKIFWIDVLPSVFVVN